MARPLVTVALAAALSGCFGSGDEDAVEEPLPPPSNSIEVVRDDGSLPSRCGTREVATRVVQFLDAIERGDEDALDRLIADADRFQWFWSDGIEAYGKTAIIEASRANAGTDGRLRLMSYLGARHEPGERIRLLHLMLNSIPRGQWLPPEVGTVVGLRFSVRRSVRDLNGLARDRIAGGKGAVACSDSTILVWSSSPLADQTLSQHAVEVCGRDTPAAPDGAVVCTA